MDLFNSFPDPFECIDNEGHLQSMDMLTDTTEIDEEIDEILLNRSTTTTTQVPQASPMHPVDLPSHRKHYGLLTFFTDRIPIIFRLSNHLYVPYIRFSFALTVLDQHQSNRISPILDMVKNLPILEMTSIEAAYYDRLIQALAGTANLMPEQHLNWSSKLLSVALLDCLLGILDCSTSFFQSTQFNVQRWQEVLEAMRQEVKSRWTIEETSVLAQVDKQTRAVTNESESVCISSTNIAERRLFFEKRLDLSLVEQVGGFVQIDSFIFPYIKSSNETTLYLHINDIRHRYHQYLLLPSSYISQFPSDSPVSQAYGLISEQARENFFWNSIHGTVYMSKWLPNPKDHDLDLKFLSLDVLLQAKGLCFVQLFEKSSLDYITSNYQNHFGRQFIVGDCTRQGGLIDQEIPYLLLGKPGHHGRTWIPTETKSSRVMTHDERLFVNCFLLYHGHGKMILSKEQRWYLEELDLDVQASPMNLFDKEYYERQQRRLFVHE